MRKQRLNIIIFLLIVAGFFACMKSEPQGEDIRRYFYTDEILEPPDDFYLIYSLSRASVVAEIIFADTSVWDIVKGSGGNYRVLVNRNKDQYPDDIPFEVMSVNIDTMRVGFEGNTRYYFTAIKNSGSTEENSKILLRFIKTDLEYTDYYKIPNPQ